LQLIPLTRGKSDCCDSNAIVAKWAPAEWPAKYTALQTRSFN